MLHLTLSLKPAHAVSLGTSHIAGAHGHRGLVAPGRDSEGVLVCCSAGCLCDSGQVVSLYLRFCSRTSELTSSLTEAGREHHELRTSTVSGRLSPGGKTHESELPHGTFWSLPACPTGLRGQEGHSEGTRLFLPHPLEAARRSQGRWRGTGSNTQTGRRPDVIGLSRHGTGCHLGCQSNMHMEISEQAVT